LWNLYKSSAGAHAPSLSEVIVSKIYRLDSHVCCLGWRCPFPVPPARRRHSMLPRFGIIHLVYGFLGSHCQFHANAKRSILRLLEN
jgi:hypothetical protein